MYWGQTNEHSVYKIHKSQNVQQEGAVHVVVDGVIHPSDIMIYHSLQQPQGRFASHKNLIINVGSMLHICLMLIKPLQLEVISTQRSIFSKMVNFCI